MDQTAAVIDELTVHDAVLRGGQCTLYGDTLCASVFADHTALDPDPTRAMKPRTGVVSAGQDKKKKNADDGGLFETLKKEVAARVMKEPGLWK